MANEQQQAVEKIERDLAELRRLFELYFRGLERFPPTDMYESLKKRTAGLLMEAARWRTVDKFRANTAYQKFQTYDRMWARELKAVEEGTSRRDKFLKNRKQGANAVDAPLAKPSASAPAAAPPPAAAADDEKLRRLYNVYMQAKKRTGEASNLSLDGLRRQLEKQIPLIKQKHKCNEVDFKVVLKDGKAMLKAVPK
ncbi:MAG: MXAN_5187 C-terminal domain-containing protein [Myxococcota bacterium]